MQLLWNWLRQPAETVNAAEGTPVGGGGVPDTETCFDAEYDVPETVTLKFSVTVWLGVVNDRVTDVPDDGL